jgi:hypothetical protein
MRRPILLVTVLAAVVVPSVPASAASQLDVPKTLAKQITSFKKKSAAKIYLPSKIGTLGIKPSRIKGTLAVTNGGGYAMELGVGSNCNGANACFVAGFYDTPGGTPAYKTKVKLRGGLTGYFKKTSCGASCSPAAIEFRVGSGLYEIQSKAVTQKTEKATMISLANSALKAGPR